MFYHKNKKYQMDMDTANAALQNILAACDKAPNTIPFDKIVLRQKANTKPYNRLIVLTAVLLLLTFLSPLVIVPIATRLEPYFAPEPVKLINDYIEDDILYLQFSGDDICYDQAYIEFPDGERTSSIPVDTDKGWIGFPYNGTEEINIYIPLENGSHVHYLLTPKHE